MNKLLFWPALAGAAALIVASSGCSTAHAQSPGRDDDDDRRIISVSGTGSIRVKPDLAVATLGTSKIAPKLPDAKSAVDSGVNQIKAALRRAGIAENDIQTVQYQIYRVQPNLPAGIREAGWKVVHMMNVRTKSPDTIANVVDAAVAAGATDVQNIYFTVDELAPHRAKARELAVKAATEKAQHLASLLKVAVGEVVSVTEMGGDFMPVQYAANARFDMAGEGMGGSGISGGQIEVSTTTQVVFGIR